MPQYPNYTSYLIQVSETRMWSLHVKEKKGDSHKALS